MTKEWRIRTARVAMAGTVVLASLFLVECKKSPGGQVAAVVNDDEITQREVRAEMSPQDQLASRDPAATMRGVLDRVIDRALLAQYAREQGLDRDPEYVTRRRQLEQALLATMAMRKIASPAASPSQASAEAFVAANPFMFGQRQQLSLDQIRMTTPNPLSKLDEYSRLSSVDAIAAALTAQNVPFTRARSQLDTGTVSNDFARQLVGAKDGEPFGISINGTSYLSAIVGRSPEVAPRDTWLASASDAVRQERGTALVNGVIVRLRRGAEITYDPAFGGIAKGKADTAGSGVKVGTP